MENLKSDASTKEVFPYDFELSVNSGFDNDGSFNMVQSVKNLEKEKDMPVSFGLHPYFKVPHESKKDVKFNFEGGKEIEEKFDIWANGKAVSIDNPGVPIEVSVPGTGTLVFDISKEYKKIWVWSQPGEDFFCVEPVMRNKGGLVDDPENVKPNGTCHTNFNIKLKED